MTAKQYLQRADNLLHELQVSGDNVFLLADARRLMKLAYDEIKKEEVKDDGGQDDRRTPVDS